MANLRKDVRDLLQREFRRQQDAGDPQTIVRLNPRDETLPPIFDALRRRLPFRDVYEAIEELDALGYLNCLKAEGDILAISEVTPAGRLAWT